VNVPKAIEIAFAKVFRTFAEIGEGVTIRAFQSLASDGSWNSEKDRTFPMVAITCGTPRYDDGQATLYADCIILCGTMVDDDADHAVWSGLYGAVQSACDSLFAQFISQSDGVELSPFKASLTEDLGPTFNGVGGLQFVDGLDPYEDGSGHIIGGIAVRVHYSRNDY
jgi:hypothetical protein